MARTKSGNKPQAIRDATIGEVADVGSTAVSVNKIAARAGLSVGTLYLYHKTKDDLLFWVFLQAKSDIHKAMMTAANAQTGAKDRLRAMWFALVDCGYTAPKDFLFVEMMAAEIHDAFRDDPLLVQMRAEMLEEIQAGINQKDLADVPAETIEVILASPAMALARRAALRGVQAELEELGRVFDLLWRGIAAR